MSYLATWASENEISPVHLTDEHSIAFEAWMRASIDTQEYARRMYAKAVRSWNDAAASSPDWPAGPIIVAPLPKRHYSLRKDEWSVSFMNDVDRMLALFTSPDVDSHHEPVEEDTAYGIYKSFFRTASAYVVAVGADPMRITSVRDILDPKAAKIAFDYQLAWAKRKNPKATKPVGIHHNAKVLSNIAGRMPRDEVPAEWVITLQEMAKNRCPPNRGMTDETRELHRLVDDEKFLSRFLDLPFVVADRIRAQKVQRPVDAVRFMLAFAMGQQIEAPLRSGNQERLELNRQVFRLSRGGEQLIAIRIHGADVKNSKDLDHELRGDIVQLYDEYIEKYRPVLLTDVHSPYLYPGTGLEPKSPKYLSRQIAKFAEEELGERITASKFRHIVGYLYLVEHPGEYEVVRQFLGHKSIITTLTFYAALDQRSAGKKLGEFIARKRAELRSRLRGGHRKI